MNVENYSFRIYGAPIYDKMIKTWIVVFNMNKQDEFTWLFLCIIYLNYRYTIF